MKIKKVISTEIDIYNAINVCSDPDNLFNIISAKFTGICFEGCLIVAVNKILRKGHFMLDQFGGPGHCTVAVTFEVSAIVYAIGEVLTGCKVIGRDASGIISCSNTHSVMYLDNNPLISSITVGQLVPVIVGRAKYNINKDQISINAIPFTPTSQPTFMLQKDELDLDFPTLLSDVKERIAEELKLRSESTASASAWDFFSKLLQPYDVTSKDSTSLDDMVKQLTNQKVGSVIYVTRNKVDVYQPNVNIDTVKPSTPYSVTTTNAVIALYEHYYNSLRVLREFVELYNTPALIESHRNIWMIIKKSKQSLA